jgi:mannose-6-phosphate isomerase-like protein (cupin superfamily)
VSGYSFTTLEELGDDYGFRKVRRALGVTAFGVNALVMPPGFPGFHHWHDTQDELYFVHRGRARVEIGDEVHELGEGGLLHVESTTRRSVSNASDSEDLVLLVVGGKDGYVERDGHLVDPERDLARRQAFGS